MRNPHEAAADHSTSATVYQMETDLHELSSDEERQELARKLEAARVGLNYWRNAHKDHQSNCQYWERAYLGLRPLLVELGGEHEKLKKEHVDLVRRHRDLDDRVSRMSVRNQQLINENEKLKVDLEDAKVECDDNLARVVELEEHIDPETGEDKEVASLLDEKHTLLKEQRVLQEAIGKLQAEVANYKRLYKERANRVHALDTQGARLTRELRAAQDNADALIKERARIVTQNQTLANRNAGLLAERDDAKRRSASWMERYESAVAERDILKETVEARDKELEKYQGASDVTRLRADLAEAIDTIELQRAEIYELRHGSPQDSARNLLIKWRDAEDRRAKQARDLGEWGLYAMSKAISAVLTQIIRGEEPKSS